MGECLRPSSEGNLLQPGECPLAPPPHQQESVLGACRWEGVGKQFPDPRRLETQCLEAAPSLVLTSAQIRGPHLPSLPPRGREPQGQEGLAFSPPSHPGVAAGDQLGAASILLAPVLCQEGTPLGRG